MSNPKQLPRLKAPDGSALQCGAALAQVAVCVTCQRPTTSVCLLRATYPDKRCALHTEWLRGTEDQRKAADDWRGKPLHLRARARAWAAWQQLLVKHHSE